MFLKQTDLVQRVKRGGLAAFGAAFLFGPLLVSSCGSKSGLRQGNPDAGRAGDAAPDVTGAECVKDADCATDNLCETSRCHEGRCTAPLATVCNDNDECTEDTCDPDNGKCAFRQLALDQDGDGFKGPRPGFAPGAPGACGDDCDDTSAKAFPGGTEVCDGVDNNCNGVVDEDSIYVPVGAGDIRVSELDQLRPVTAVSRGMVRSTRRPTRVKKTLGAPMSKV